MHTQNCDFRFNPNHKTGRDQHLIVTGRGINMLDLINGFNDTFQRLGDQFDRIISP